MEWISAAISFYKATLAVITGLSAPYSNSAIIYKQQGHYAGAIACYNEVLRIDPMAADGLVNRGNTLKDSGHVEAAIKSHKHPWRCDLLFQKQHAICCIPYSVYVAGKIVICIRMLFKNYQQERLPSIQKVHMGY